MQSPKKLGPNNVCGSRNAGPCSIQAREDFQHAKRLGGLEAQAQADLEELKQKLGLLESNKMLSGQLMRTKLTKSCTRNS